MKGLLTFLTVVIVLAVVRAVLVALLVGLALMLLFSFIARPRETLVFVGTLTLFGLASAQPIACIIGLGIVARKCLWKELSSFPRTHGAP